DRLTAEARAVLSRCQSPATAAVALDQLRGAMAAWAAPFQTSELKVDLSSFRNQAKKLQQTSRLGLRLDRPFQVVLIGPPNVGKSSLINAIVGKQRAITDDVAGTTRDVLRSNVVIDQIAITLADTAGIRNQSETSNAIESEGIQRAEKALSSADVLVVVSDPSCIDDHCLRRDQYLEKANVTPRIIDVINKCDLIDASLSNERSITGKLFSPLSRSLPAIPAARGRERQFGTTVIDHSLLTDTGAPGVGFNVSGLTHSQPEHDGLIQWILTSTIQSSGITALMQQIAIEIRSSFPPPGSPVIITQRQANLVDRMATCQSSRDAKRQIEALVGKVG
ncbi:MAG: GTPase, partial [Planctomycetota bacterium]